MKLWKHKKGLRQMKGTVKSFNKRKGYGFINCEDGNTAFFHYSELNMEGFKTILPEKKVSYDVIDTEKGLRAINITIDE